MVEYISIGFIILVFCDSYIRKVDKDTKLKRIWFKLIKKPISQSLSELKDKGIKTLEKKYGKDPNTGMLNIDNMED